MIHYLNLKRTHVRAGLVTAGVDDIRHYLNGALFELHADRSYMVTTDGHRLAAIRMEASDPPPAADAKPVTFIVPRSMLESVKACRIAEAVSLTYDDATQAVAIVDVINGTTASGKAIDGTFPDWRRVIPHKVSGKPAQYNVDYLASFGKVATALGAGRFSLGVTFAWNGSASAVVAISCAPEYVGVIMPMRDEDRMPDVALFLDPAKVTAQRKAAKAAEAAEATDERDAIEPAAIEPAGSIGAEAARPANDSGEAEPLAA